MLKLAQLFHHSKYLYVHSLAFHLIYTANSQQDAGLVNDNRVASVEQLLQSSFCRVASVSHSIYQLENLFFTVKLQQKPALLKEKVSNPRISKIFGLNSKPCTVEARVAQGRVAQGPAVPENSKIIFTFQLSQGEQKGRWRRGTGACFWWVWLVWFTWQHMTANKWPKKESYSQHDRGSQNHFAFGIRLAGSPSNGVSISGLDLCFGARSRIQNTLCVQLRTLTELSMHSSSFHSCFHSGYFTS